MRHVHPICPMPTADPRQAGSVQLLSLVDAT
jgi:hypothetical protein